MPETHVWPIGRLGDHAYIKGRIGWRGLKSSEYTDDGPYLIAGNHLRAGRVDWTTCDHISMYRYDESLEIALQEGDVILTKDGTIGRVAIIDKLPGLATINSTMMLVRARLPLESRYVFHYLTGDAFQKVVQDKVSGSSIPHIFQRDMVELPIPVPPECEQRRIADILDAADAAIQQTDALIAKFKQIKAGLLHDLLTRGLDAHGRLRDPAAQPEEFVESPVERIPVRWKATTIGALAVHVGSGATPKGGSEVYKLAGVLFIRSQNVTFDGLLLDDVAYIDQTTHSRMLRSEIFAHDVLLNITGASIGRCCPFPEGMGDANVNQHVCAIRLPEPTREEAVYLSAVLASHIGQLQIDRLNAGGNRQGLNYEQLKSFWIPWPESEERDRIAAVLDAHDARIRAEEAYRDKLVQVKRGLMEDLLTGRVRVA
jgi:type I restriction enzyme S subunit